MKYLPTLHASCGTGDCEILRGSPEDFQGHTQRSVRRVASGAPTAEA